VSAIALMSSSEARRIAGWLQQAADAADVAALGVFE
jgi:hypothetical protein